MANADEIIDRRRLRRKLSFWRIATFAVLAITLLSMIVFAARDTLFSGAQTDHIARVKISGVITNDQPMLSLLEKLKDNEKVSAVILNISSPGGSTVGGEAMFEAVRNLAEEKPVVSTVGTLAASAGYMIASGTDHIVARRSSIVGSIGVLFQYADASELLDKIGVKVNAVKSSPLKAEPSPFNPASEEAVAMIDRVIQDSYNWFVDIVVDRRQMSRAEVLTLADGSIFTGSQGEENGLIDAIGGEAKALEWLQDEKDISDDLKVIEYKPKRPGDSLFDNPAALHKIARILGINLSNADVIQIEEAIRNRLLLDGLVSIWQGSR
ncbi:MAG: signal peptide peptidase SppA [Pseudomonadota bacterium]